MSRRAIPTLRKLLPYGRLFSLTTLLSCAIIVQAEEAATPAPAQPAKLTLEQAVEIGLQRQPAIAAARASLNSAIASKYAADSLMANLTGPQIHTRRKQADLGVAIAQAGVEQAELETTNAVTRTYLTAVYAGDQVHVASDSVDRFKSLFEVSEKLVKDGSKEVTTSDTDRIGTYRMLAESKLVEARSGISRAKAALREAMGLTTCDAPIDLAVDRLWYQPVKISAEKAVQLALCHRPELVQANLAAQLTAYEITAQKWTMHSKAQTFAATGDIHSKVLPATVINGEYRPGAVGPEMPVVLAGSKKDRVLKAGHLYDRSVAVADKAKNLVVLEVEETCLRLQEQMEQVRVLSDANQKANKLAKDGERFFRADQLSAEKMLNAQVVEAQTKAQLNEAIYKYGSAMASLHRVTGGHFWDCVVKE